MNTARGSRSILHRPRQQATVREINASREAQYNEAAAIATTMFNTTFNRVRSIVTQLSSRQTSAPTPIPDPEPEFLLFSALPKELRTKVFAVALHLPRNNPVSAPTRSHGSKRKDNLLPVRWPALLHVCQESREEAVMFYEGISGMDGLFKTDANTVVGRMGHGDVKGRNRIAVAGWWWDISVVG